MGDENLDTKKDIFVAFNGTGKDTEAPPNYGERGDHQLPEFIPKEAPVDEGFVTISRFWALLVFVLGVSIKLYGYLQKEASADNQKFSLYTAFIHVIGVVCFVALFYILKKQATQLKGYYVYDPHNGSWYLKSGFLVFSLGHMMHCVIEVIADIDILKQDPECAGPTAENIIFQVIVFAYTLFQFILLFKFSKTTFLMHKKTSMLCLSHLVACCLVSWFCLVTDEIAESLEWKEHLESESECGNIHLNSEPAKLAKEAKVYLLPMAIEMYLIAAGFFAIMGFNVGTPHVVRDPSGHVVSGGAHKESTNSKLFIGDAAPGVACGSLFILVATIMVILFARYETQWGPTLASFYHGVIVVINIAQIVGMAWTYSILRHHGLSPHFHNRLDAPLLGISLTGMILYSMFSFFAGVESVSNESYASHDAITTLLAYLSHVIEGVLQTCFLFDTLRRTAAAIDFSRNCLLVLLSCNLALWLMQMFEMDSDDANPMQIDVYGFHNWALISHIMGPLAIFFRFHSTACLFDVWHNAFISPSKVTEVIPLDTAAGSPDTPAPTAKSKEAENDHNNGDEGGMSHRKEPGMDVDSI